MESVGIDDSLDVFHQRESCFAHSLQLVIKDAQAKCLQAMKSLPKAGCVVSYAHTSSIATDILDG